MAEAKTLNESPERNKLLARTDKRPRNKGLLNIDEGGGYYSPLARNPNGSITIKDEEGTTARLKEIQVDGDVNRYDYRQDETKRRNATSARMKNVFGVQSQM